MQIRSTFKNASRKTKIIWAGLTVAILVFSIGCGYLLAYLVKPVEARVNNFTLGDVKIELTEDQWDDLDSQERVVYPKKELPKNPIIHNISESDNGAYVFVKIGVPRREVRLVTEDGSVSSKTYTDLFTYTVGDDWIQLEGPTLSVDGLYNEYVYAYSSSLAKGKQTTAVFETIRFANVLEGDLLLNETLAVSVDAFGIQEDYVSLSGANVADKMKNLYDSYLKNSAQEG